MAIQTVTATDSKTDEKVSFSFDFGDNLKDATEKFGEEVVFSLYKQKAVISAQSVMRAYQKKGLTPADITEKMADWKPGTKVPREAVDVIQSAINKFHNMSDEDQKAFIAALQKRKAG